MSLDTTKITCPTPDHSRARHAPAELELGRQLKDLVIAASRAGVLRNACYRRRRPNQSWAVCGVWECSGRGPESPGFAYTPNAAPSMLWQPPHAPSPPLEQSTDTLPGGRVDAPALGGEWVWARRPIGTGGERVRNAALCYSCLYAGWSCAAFCVCPP